MDAQRLRAIPLFSTISKKDLDQVARWADEVDVPVGKHLVEQGKFAHEFFVIESGTAEVVVDGERVAELGPGDFFGEIGLLEKSLRTATVEATAPMKLITLTGWDLARVEKAMPDAIEELHRAIEERRPRD